MFSAIVSHVLGMLVAPFLLAVGALLLIRRIIVDLLPVILSLPSSLALAPAAYHLIGMIMGRREEFSTVWATGKRHVHESHGLLRRPVQ